MRPGARLHHGWLARVALSVALLMLAGGAALADPSAALGATTVELTIVGGPALNPNSQGRPSPVVVRVFDLAAAPAFESADYSALFETPGDALKSAIATQEEFILRPGDIEERNRTLQPRVTMLGVAAAFRDLDHAVWHLTIPVKAGQRNFLLVQIDQDRIRLEPVDSGKK